MPSPQRTAAAPKPAKNSPSAGTVRKVGFVLTAIVLALYLAGNQLFDLLELKTYDMRLLAHAARPADPQVAIAAIDEKSIATLGRWPWSRATMARLIDKLDALGARVVAFDVFFSESENAAALEQIRRIEIEQGYVDATSPFLRVKRLLGADASFAQAIARNRHVVLPMVFLMSPEEAAQLPPSRLASALRTVQGQAIRLIRDSGDGKLDFPLPKPAGLVVNLPELTAAARYVGHINTVPDLDGSVRWSPLVIRYQGLFFPAADVYAALLYSGQSHLALRTSSYGITGLEIGERFLPTDENGRVLIHYHGPEKTFPTVSVADIASGNVSPGIFKNKIVLIGATAKGLGDVRVTPFAASYPGVEIRANTIQNLLDADFIRRPGWMIVFDIAAILAFGLLLTVALARVGVRTAISLTVLAIIAYLGVAFALFAQMQIWLNIVYPTVLALLLFTAATITRYFSVEGEKRQIKGAFQHYVPAAVVDRIMENMDDLRLGGDKRELTVLFSDIRGFTTLAETLEPEELVKLLNVYLTEMTDVVFDHGGLLDKYIGDAVMAVYGAPIARDDHALAACQTAVTMMQRLHRLREDWRQRDLPAIDIGIGINTGPMIVGNMGSKSRFDYTVIGDAVNLGSRIEALNKVYGTHILISEYTYKQVRAAFPYTREIDIAQIKGRQESVRLYEILLAEAYPNMEWLPEFNRAYDLFRAGLLARARPVFEQITKEMGDAVSGYYVQRCKVTRRKAPL